MRANVEDRGMKGDCTPLMEAASAGHTGIVEKNEYCEENIQHHLRKIFSIVLEKYLASSCLDIVRLLIAHGADVNAQSSSGNTPLMYACAGGHEDVVRVLLEAGAHVEVGTLIVL